MPNDSWSSTGAACKPSEEYCALNVVNVSTHFHNSLRTQVSVFKNSKINPLERKVQFYN